MAKFVLFRTDWLKDIDECGRAVDAGDIIEVHATSECGVKLVLSQWIESKSSVTEMFACEHITDVVAKINAARTEDRS